MGRRTELAVVVACDDVHLCERVGTALGAADGIEVVDVVDTTRMISVTTRRRPDAVVLVIRRPRHVDLGRIGSLTRDRAKRPPVVVLLVDAPQAVEERAHQAGATLVGQIPAEDAGGLAADLHRLCAVRRGSSGSSG